MNLHAATKMGNKFSSWILILQLLPFTCILGNAAGEMHEETSSSDMHTMHSAAKMFFTLKDLKIGNKLPIYFPNVDPENSPPILPKEETESIPFSSKQLPYLLQFFSIPKDSPAAKIMESTLTVCEAEPVKGETKHCATSIESMLDFVATTFGSDTPFQTLKTNTLDRNFKTHKFQNYTVLGVHSLSVSKVVSCHPYAYPYAIFYCHSPMEYQTKVFNVSLDGEENGERIEAAAVCHLDTSQWNPKHAAFKLLGVKPGSSEVCHFFPEDHLVWVPR